jgi:hypothetical protein
VLNGVPIFERQRAAMSDFLGELATLADNLPSKPEAPNLSTASESFSLGAGQEITLW